MHFTFFAVGGKLLEVPESKVITLSILISFHRKIKKCFCFVFFGDSPRMRMGQTKSAIFGSSEKDKRCQQFEQSKQCATGTKLKILR